MEKYIQITLIIVLVGIGKALKEFNKARNKSQYNSAIPFILYLVGMIIGFVMNRSLEGVAIGVVSGLLAVAIHQTGYQGYLLAKEGKFSELLKRAFGETDDSSNKEE